MSVRDVAEIPRIVNCTDKAWSTETDAGMWNCAFSSRYSSS